MTAPVAPIGSVDELVELLERGAAVTDAEPVDLLAHALQTAAIVTVHTPDDAELQLAGLVHDIGWLLGAPAHEHANVGATAVAGLLGARVARLVEHHVTAKRYLVAVDPDYALSPRSRQTLALEGGPLDAAAAEAFVADPDAEAVLALRRADDAAKEPDVTVPGLDHWRPILESTFET